MKTAIIGTGVITENLIDAARGQDIQLDAVLSRNAEKGQKYADSHGISRVFTDISALAESDIEAVYIASPNYCHASYAIGLLKHGKHVLCEKPLAATLEEARAMYRAADEGGAVLMEAMRSVHDPGFKKLGELVKTIGTVRRAHFTFCQYSRRYDNFRRGIIENAFNPALANAAVMDIGVYCAAPMVRLFGIPDAVSATSLFLSNGFEGEGSAALKYPGMIGELQYSKITQGYAPCEIQGEDGTILFSTVTDIRRIEIKRRGQEDEVYIIDGKANNMYYEVTEFIRLVSGAPDIHREHSLNTMKVLDEIRRQAGVRFDV